ncbi:hypothetical protein BpHYR1_044771 [Brachionus plicatilis]|uniref:Uncharacterized protein n=1 Tax=Brachionus plicatilis TaxID=10195 RepID=A0A3M7R7Q5_BRAPC|nr:hypothetical protein BpHYR1_044771 [Brachionus plicatilis]
MSKFGFIPHGTNTIETIINLDSKVSKLEVIEIWDLAKNSLDRLTCAKCLRIARFIKLRRKTREPAEYSISATDFEIQIT